MIVGPSRDTGRGFWLAVGSRHRPTPCRVRGTPNVPLTERLTSRGLEMVRGSNLFHHCPASSIDG